MRILTQFALRMSLARASNSCFGKHENLNFFFFSFSGPRLWHMEVPRLGVASELLLPIYTTATAMPDPNRICDLHCSSWQRQILNPLSEARD